MVAFHRHEAWDHTASLVAAVYQTANTEEGNVFYPQQFHPGYEPIDAETNMDNRLPVGAVPQEMVFNMMKKTFVEGG